MKRSFGPSTSAAVKRFKLEEFDEPESSDTESILSVQFKSTDFAEDTEDTSSDSETSYEGNIRRKFILSSSEESELQEIAELGQVVMGAVLETNLDIGLADTSEENSTSPTSNSDVDPGLPRSDYIDFEKCLMCQTKKKDSSYPYCSKCYKDKKSFFPQRPKRRRKTSLLRRKTLSGESSSDLLPGASSELQSSQDSGISSSQGMTETEISVGRSPPRRDSNIDSKNLCEICLEKKKSGLFFHSRSAHLYGCYPCAKRSWFSTNGGCPLCRKKVYQVVRLLNNEDDEN